MTTAEDILKVKDARDKMGEVFESQVKDDIFDNGLLDLITNCTKNIETLIQKLKERENG